MVVKKQSILKKYLNKKLKSIKINFINPPNMI